MSESAVRAETETTIDFIDGIRHAIWQYQQQLVANPDPDSEWAFLIDPGAPEPTVKNDWRTQ